MLTIYLEGLIGKDNPVRVKGREKVHGEYAHVFTCYNLRRLLTIPCAKNLISAIKKTVLRFFDLLPSKEQDMAIAV